MDNFSKEQARKEQIRAEVARFWNAFTSKDADALQEFYAHDSVVFSSGSTRPEPGRLAATRRQREYFHPETNARVQTGYVDVALIGEVGAVASYTFSLKASHVMAAGGMHARDLDNPTGRATQVFIFDSDGKLRIVHEHLSAAAKWD